MVICGPTSSSENSSESSRLSGLSTARSWKMNEELFSSRRHDGGARATPLIQSICASAGRDMSREIVDQTS